MVIGLNIDLDCFTHFFKCFSVVVGIRKGVKFHIDRDQINLAFEAIDGSHDSDRAILSFIVDVFYDQSSLFRNIIVRADVLIDLVHGTLSLSDVSASLLKNLFFLTIGPLF
jgi:hypothetical protein